MADVKGVVQLDLTGFESFTEFAKMFSEFKAQADAFAKEQSKNAAYTARLAEISASLKKSQNDVDKSIKNLNKDLKETIKFSADVAKNFFSIGVSLSKWMTFGAIAGGFGFGALAGSASDARRQAQGLGTSTGDLRAARVNFGKYINPESALGNIADVKSDLSRSYILSMLGGKAGQNPAEMLPALMKNAVRLFKRGGENEQTAKAMKLTEIFPMEDLRRLSALTEQELNRTIEDFQADRKKLANSDEENKVMQDFWIQLKRAGETIETSLIGALKPLMPQLQELTRVIGDAIVAFIKSDEVKKALKDFTDWLSSDGSKKAMRDFFDGLKNIAEIMLKLTALLPDLSRPEDTPAGMKAINGKTYKGGVIDQQNIENYFGGDSPLGRLFNSQNPQYQKLLQLKKEHSGTIGSSATLGDFFANLESANKLPAGLLAKVRANESSGNDNAVSPKGAQGPFQLMPDTAKDYGVTDPFDVKNSAQGAGKLLHHLMEKYNNNLADALAAYNWGEGNLDKFIKGPKNGAQLPKETSDYLHRFNINVTTSAGSDLNVIAKAM